MMTDPDYANKMSSAVDNTRKVNTNLMNKSEEYESSLSLDKPASQPLDLARVGEMKAEDAARATMPSEESDYSGVSDLATKLYAEERSKRIGKAEQRSNAYVGAPHGMRFSQAAADIYDVEKAKNVQGIYDKVLQDESVSKAIRINADKALSKAMEANQSLNEEEQKKVYDDAVSKQLEAIGKGIDKYLYDINAPKSEAEWIAKNAVNSSIMGQMLTSPMNVEGGENAYRQQALADYGAKASWLSQGISMAGSLIIDTLPMMGIGTAFAAPASKAAMWGVGKVGGKALQGSLIGRGVVGSVGGAATLGGYNAASALTTQFSNGQFDLGEIISSAGHGALMGGLTGVMSPVLRGVSQGMGKVGKAATMAGGLGAEAGIFSAAELAEMENPYDFETIAQTFGKNVVVIGGLKLSNPIKTISEYKRWYNEGKQSNFDDADYKMMADFAKANGFANNEAFSMSADGVYSRSIADRVTGNRTLLELTKLEGGKERNLAIEMYNDLNVPISLKTKIAAKMNLPAPKPLLANGVRVEGNKAITYCTMPNGAQQVIEIKEFARPRNARAFANEFSRTTARKNDLMQTEAAVNNISTEPIVIARLNEQAKRNGTTYEEELARLNDIVQRAAEGAISAEDVAYYSSIVDTDISATEAIKQGIKNEYGVEIDDVLKSDGNLTDAQDKAMTAYADALRGIAEQGNPTTERMLVASTAGVADYVALNRLDIEQTRGILTNPTQRAEIDAQMRSKYGAWLKYFDGKMGEDALAAKLGYDLNNSTDLQNFLAEQTYFKNKAADRIAANTTDVAKQLLEQGGRGVRFTEGGKVKLQGVPYPIEVSQEIVDRYDAAMQGSGEPMSRIVNDALKDIIKQSETPSAAKEPIIEEAPDAIEQPMTESEAITQQMVDARLAEIDTDLQGIQADGVQKMTINGQRSMVVKGRIVADINGQVDKTKSSTEVAYMLLDENGRPILDENGRPKIEVGVKPSNVHVEDIEPWRRVDEYKASEEQRIRENNRITDEAMRQADEQMAVEEQPTEQAKEIIEPQTTEEMLQLCNGDKELAIDVATDELNRAMQSKGKGATPAETMEINKRIRMYQQMLNELSRPEQPVEAPKEQVQEPQVTEDMEFVYQQGLDENHDGMEPMQTTDGRYKWVGLQRGELTANMGEKDVELLDNLAKKLGVAVIPINVADRAVNGYYRDGNIYVNTNRGAEWTMRWVAGHEMLHDVAKKSPDAYNAYKQAVLDMWGEEYVENQVKQIIEDYKASGKQIDREQALTELVNDFGGELFNSRDGLGILDNILKTESSKGNVGFVDTIKQWWEKLKEWFSGTPYYSEAQKMLEKAYKDAMENVDYQAKQEQVVKDMDDAFFGETNVTTQKSASVELAETKDYTPTKMPRGVVVGNKESKDYSVKQIMRGVGIDAQTDGDNVWFERDGKKFDKYNPMTIEESKSGILKDMVDQCMELGLMDEAKAEDVYKMYTGIVNKIIEKADGSFVDLNNQYLWLGESVYKVVHSNSDKQYKRSLDITLVCKKNEAVIRGISELQRRQGFGVTPSQIMQLYYSTLDKGFQVPCPVCYVFSRYIQNGQYISNLIYGHHKFDKDKYFKNPAQMSAKKKAEAEQYWLEKYNEAVAWEEANAKLIADAKSVLSWATKEMDMLMLDAAKGNLDKAKRNEYKERAKKLDSWYRAALDLVSQSDMSGHIKSVIANPIIKNKKVVGMEMREDAGQKMTQEVEETILDYRKVALAKTKYPHISRYISSKGSAAGKGFNFEADNPMGDILQQLSTDSYNYFQEAMKATSEKERSELMKSAKERTMKSAIYAAQQSLRGGVRQWSWSDNIEALAPDVALNAMQVGMLGGAMQTYSKQLEGIEMMAAMGAYVNGSLMGKGMGYQKVSENYSESPKWQDPNTGFWYTLAFDDVVGVQPRSLNGKLGLFALNQMYDKAGNILVGMNDIHIRTAMADPRIFFIIPWHASGMSDHILKQMNSMLKLDMAGFKASDYTKHQEEKMYKGESGTDNAEEGNGGKVPESTTALWRSHDYSDRFVNNDGTKANIAIEDGTLSADQLHYRELRDAIFMHSNAESAKDTDKAFWAVHQDWLAEIKNDIFLNQAYESVTNGPGRFGVAMTTADCGFIYPYEYWDKASTFDNADINGQRYVEYCRRLGVKPKFSGVDSGSASEYGNFVDDAGYWKLLIDRRMYDRNGNFQDLTPVDASGFNADFVDQDKTSARFPVTVVADKEQTSTIVDDVQYNELKTYKKKKLKVDYKALPETAVKKAAEALMEYNQAKQLVSMTKTGKRSVKIQKELYELELGRLADEEALADIMNDNFMDNEGAEMSIVRDRNKIDELEGEELIPMYRTFQVLDGRLYPPMATIQAGKKVHSIAEGDWWKSDENPDKVEVKIKGSKAKTGIFSKDDDRISKKDGQWVITIDGEDKPLSMREDGSLAYYFNLKKGEKGDEVSDDLDVAYNPYIHMSKSALNDQFKGAYLRPNLVLVEVLVPKSEIDGTNRYKADYAKDGIGIVPWNSGDVIKQAVAAGHPGREVALSRYAKIGRVFTNAEWADQIDAELAPYKDKIVLPFVMFPPEVLRGLANKGYKIEPPTSKKAQPYYEKWLNGEQPTDPNGGGKPIDAEFSVKRRFGGNSGYVGYSKSVRAVDAEERGLRSVSKMDADFKDRVNAILADNGVANPVSLAEIKRIAKGMKGDEWHHTSMYGNRTEYYSAEAIAEKIMGKQSKTTIDPRISADLERMSYRESLADKMKTDRDIKVEVDLGNGEMYTYTKDAFRSSDGLLFAIEKALREQPIEKQSQIRILNTGQVDNRELYLPEWYIDDHSKEIAKAVAEYNSALAKAKQELDAEFSIKTDKQKQLDVINRTNPAHDDYHTWIRTTDDIKTLQEAVDEVKAEDADYNLSAYPDVSDDMINEALQSGKITIYSSKPIKEGVFVSPSQMQAKDYAGGGRIYSKQVPINDVAWINTDEGMFAPVEYSVKGKQADESVLDYAKRMSEETGKKNLLNGGSYFSGGGLLEEGLKGIVNPTIAVEFNQKVAGVYRNNFGEHIVTADVRNVDPASLVKDIDGPVAYFHASPVCKNFSRAKRNAEELPLDKETAQSTAKFISEVRPKIVTIENVKGYRNSEAMKIILDELEKQGYNYDADTYNAADYGAYTSRERLIVRAVRDWALPPKPIKMLAEDRPSGWLEAVADLIDGLPQTKSGVPDWMDVRLKAMGIDYRNIDKPLYVFGSGYSKDRIGCAFSDELVPALRTKGGDIIIMPDGRVLKATPRVLARISGMSDDYVMPKTDDLAHTIVGNGIPVQLTKAVMGSLIKNVKSDLDSSATEYSIIGKRGAANLDKRDESGIRADNLVTAEDMEKAGKDAKIIRMATGWERGADGKWRYEIADAKLLPWEVWSKKRAPKLKDIVENADELFAAYPELEDVKVKKGSVGDFGGSFSDNVITLNSGEMKFLEKYGSAEDLQHCNEILNSTLIHEIQHYIQDAEGFAQGGNESTIIDKKLREEVSSLIDEINGNVDIYNSLSSNDPARQQLQSKIINDKAKLKRLRSGSRLGAGGYHRLAGEVEARNAEKRLGMTEEERKNSLLADTEDVGRDEQIVYGNTDADYSIKKGGKNLEDRLESKYTQTRLRAARELAGDDESALMILDDLEPQTLEEYVAVQLGANGRKLLWENGKFSKGLKAHLGASENEKKTYRSIISKDGYPPEVLAEEIWKSMPEEFYERYTDQDVFNTILDLASSYTRKQLKDFVVNSRIDAVIEFARKQEEWDAAQEEMYLETLSEQERNAYLANKEEMERVDKMSKKERAEYYKQKQVEQMLGEMTPEERAEYEAKEQWRKDNAAAITSSFFAERRLDKADKIQKLKDEINKLIKETRATNKENSEKVQQIAKEMQTYIKENIPTETQGDMTRPQFEQVIKQLSNAITRKDLEKPMRMVEYIGANANRRALTRQMRDFLKQGFKGMTPKGLVKAKNVDGATSRVLGLAKSLYESMGKQPLGSDLRALQTKVRGIKAELEDLNNANGGAFGEYVEQIGNILKKSGVDRYEEMTKYYNELSDRQDVGEIQVSEVLDHINRILPELFSIELVKEQRTQAKAESAMTTKEDLEQLKNNLEDKREKGILSEEDQAVLDNMAMYELMVDLQQRQLDIDGPGTSSIASQMAAKVREAKQYRDELEKYDDKKSGIAKNLKDNIKRVNAEMEELFVQRTQAQKEVNANVAELLDNLKQLRDTGNSALKEWSKNKQERETRIVTMANASFGKDARGYWSEVDRRGGWKRDFSNRINNLRLAALMSPALSFEYMVGVMDPRYYTNESPIYKQFIKGEDGLIKANDNFFEGLESFNNGINEAVERFINRNAMQSLKEYFNKGDRFATEIIPFEFEVKENVNGEVVTSIVHRDAEMTRGRAAKIYAWSRMADGMAKLKAHGVTDETLEVVKAFIGQDYMDFIDWVEDVYFPKLRREKYNPIYKKMYGISMAENEHYFPFETYKKDIRTEKELEQINSDNLGGGIVGNIIERKRNNARLDFTDESPDIFDAISEYGRKMEEWAAYAQVREDLKKVINNKQFKQHCDMLGTNYYNHFLDAARVASRLYNPQPSAPQLQSAAAKLQKVFASAAISLRVSTALKQLLSAPAFAVYSLDPAFHKELLKTASVIDVESAIKGLRELANGNKAEAKRLLLEENWVGHYNWCVNNLPSFRERVSKGGAGNPILEEKGWSKFSDDVQSVGMLPNRLVDAFTCSVGAKAIYEYAFNKYKKTYDEATAHNMAVTDAEIAFNSSQQSSNPVFLSPLQSSKEFWLRGIMNYKNSPIGYYRNGMKANIDLYRATKALFGKPKFTINGEQVGFESNGVNPAAKAAEAAAKSIMFNFFLNYLWAFGTIGIAGVSYTMMNNDNENGNMLYTDEEFDKATGGNMGLAVFNAATQGIPWVSGFASVSQTGQDYTPSILFSEMNSYLEQVNKEGFMSLATAQLLIDLGLKNAIGVDPEVWGQIYRGAQGIMSDRPMRVEDFMNLLASPRSAIAGVAKQKVGDYNNMQDYVNARIESEREIGINETMDLGKKLTGLRPLRKSKLDGYIDEYLAYKIPDYRELANKPDEKAKEERMEESNAFKNLNTLVSTVQHTEEKKKSSKKIDGNEETKDKVKKIRKAVNVIHKLYASGDASSAQRIADELERRLKRGYNENGASLDDKLKNVDIYDSTGTTEQRGTDGFDTMFDRAMLGGFNKTYLGNDRLD